MPHKRGLIHVDEKGEVCLQKLPWKQDSPNEKMRLPAPKEGAENGAAERTQKQGYRVSFSKRKVKKTMPLFGPRFGAAESGPEVFFDNRNKKHDALKGFETTKKLANPTGLRSSLLH